MFKGISQVMLALSLLTLSHPGFAKDKKPIKKESRKVASGGRVGSSETPTWSLPKPMQKELIEHFVKVNWLTKDGAKLKEIYLDNINCSISVNVKLQIETGCVGSSGEWGESKVIKGVTAQKLMNILLLMRSSDIDKSSEPGTTYVSASSIYCRSLEGLGDNGPMVDYVCSETGRID